MFFPHVPRTRINKYNVQIPQAPHAGDDGPAPLPIERVFAICDAVASEQIGQCADRPADTQDADTIESLLRESRGEVEKVRYMEEGKCMWTVEMRDCFRVPAESVVSH